MKISRYPGMLAGFHLDEPEAAIPELTHAGEEWVSRQFRIRLHQHPTWELYLQHSGQSRWEFAGEPYVLTAGNFVAIPPGLPHRMAGSPDDRHHYVYAGVDLPVVLARVGLPADLWRQEALIHVPSGQTLSAPFRQLLREASLKLPYREWSLRAALDCLAVEATRALQSRPPSGSWVAGHPAVLRAKEVLEHQPGADWRLADLARVAGLSPSRLLQLFTREVGLSPRQYLLGVRVAQARVLLTQNDLPITELALELGFSSGQHFATTFKRLTGMTARQCREAGRG